MKKLIIVLFAVFTLTSCDRSTADQPVNQPGPKSFKKAVVIGSTTYNTPAGKRTVLIDVEPFTGNADNEFDASSSESFSPEDTLNITIQDSAVIHFYKAQVHFNM